MKILLYGHGGCYNHGAEAIVKMTIKHIRNKFPEAEIAISSHFPEQDRQFAIDAQLIFEPDKILWEKEKLADNAKEKQSIARLMYADALNYIDSETILYSIGGDNYCYPNWHRLAVFQERAVQVGAKSILWSASIEPSLITTEMLSVLNTYDKITARESITYEALKRRNYLGELLLVKDVAFSLESKRVVLPKDFSTRKYIALNLSPLIIRREDVAGIILKNYLILMEYILCETSYNIALVPHVVMSVDNDYTILSQLYQKVSEDNKQRVWLVDDKLSASEYKYIISESAALICSRTHASIAAYSKGVPCLVVGYSVKSTGIAKDLGLEKFVLAVNDVKHENCLKQMFVNMMEEMG